jgi:predicted hotdog family 3-hydroxylacyl-ACP dehydratase
MEWTCSHPIEALLPHARPMILIDRALSADPGHIETELTVRPGTPFFEPGKGIAAHIAIEWMAQTCAAYVGLEALMAGQPVRIGFLLGTRNFTAMQSWFAAGETYRVRATIAFRDAETGVFDCVVRQGDIEVARAQLTLHQPNDIHAVLASQGIELKR